MEISEIDLKDERHQWLWNNYERDELSDLILSLAGEYQGARLIDLASEFNYNLAIVVVELEFGTDIEDIAENFLLEMERVDDFAEIYFGKGYYLHGELDEIPF